MKKFQAKLLLLNNSVHTEWFHNHFQSSFFLGHDNERFSRIAKMLKERRAETYSLYGIVISYENAPLFY